MTAPNRAEPAFLRRDVHGRAIYMPFGSRSVAFLVPEGQVAAFSRWLGYLVVGSIIVLLVIWQGQFAVSTPRAVALSLVFIVALALTLWLWVPRRLVRATLSRNELPPVDLSPRARAARLGKPLLWLQLPIWGGLTLLGLAVLRAKPVIGLSLTVVGGVGTWDSIRCLRTAYATSPKEREPAA